MTDHPMDVQNQVLGNLQVRSNSCSQELCFNQCREHSHTAVATETTVENNPVLRQSIELLEFHTLSVWALLWREKGSNDDVELNVLGCRV